MMALDVKRFTARFVEEAQDHLRRLEEGLSALQANPSDQENINQVFRSAHTIKGSSRMLKFTAINETAHKLEDVLGALRGGEVTYTPELGRLIQRAVDAIAVLVQRIAEGREPIAPESALLGELARAAGSAGPGKEDAPGEAAVGAGAAKSAEAAPTPAPRLNSPDMVRVSMQKLDELLKLMGEMVASHARLRQRMADIRAIERAHAVTHGRAAELRQFTHDFKDDVLAQELLIEELYGKALVMRMLPLGIIFDSLPRMVRALARSVGKEAECLVSGSEIELDRQLIDRIGDPLLHLLRNAVDHGIEEPAARELAGKPRHGRVHLAARHDAGAVVIEVSDDGGGLPLAAIREKAVRKGLITAEQAASLSDAKVGDLIFLPGLSTNAIITDLSGRGVGMDVVKRCIVDDLQGAISIDTRTGLGTTFVLRVPLSLALMRVLLVEAGGDTFGFTAQQVTRLLRLPADRLMTVAERPVVIDDNEFIPVVGLAELFGLPLRQTQPEDELLLVVVQVRDDKLALQVDGLVDEHDMVIKPLPAHLAHLPMVSGMVVTGRDTLVSVLHAPALLDMARKARTDVRLAEDGAARAQTRLLVVDDSLNTREIVRDVLEAHGYSVVLAEDGADALQKAARGKFDAVLTDVEMPKMDGFTLTATLRNDDHYRRVPIIIVTSRQKEEDKRRGIEVGADAYIVKGDFDQNNLVQTLRTLLG
jgi:two-component system, chemotaxis family, sensor kinase CheA